MHQRRRGRAGCPSFPQHLLPSPPPYLLFTGRLLHLLLPLQRHLLLGLLYGAQQATQPRRL